MRDREIHNAPRYAEEYKYIVAREVNGDLWFWGAYSDVFKADQAAEEINGVVITNKNF